MAGIFSVLYEEYAKVKSKFMCEVKQNLEFMHQNSGGKSLEELEPLVRDAECQPVFH